MRNSSWDMKWYIFFYFGPFFAILTPFPLTNQKTKIFKKWKNHLEMSSFSTCATKNTIIWCIITQIWSACTDIISSHFRPFFALLPHYWPWKLKFGENAKKYLEVLSYYTCVPLIKIMMYGSWDMKFNRQNVFVIVGNFLPF